METVAVHALMTHRRVYAIGSAITEGQGVCKLEMTVPEGCSMKIVNALFATATQRIAKQLWSEVRETETH